MKNKKSDSIVDRKRAIEYSIEEVKAGDTILIVGKGHEDYQIIGRDKIWLDDRALARAAIRKREEQLNLEGVE